MNEVRYDSLEKYLKTGREIEFSYNGKNYSITNNPTGYWYLCLDTDMESVVLDKICPFDELDYLATKIADTIIDEITIRHIFDELLYDPATLFIG